MTNFLLPWMVLMSSFFYNQESQQDGRTKSRIDAINQAALHFQAEVEFRCDFQFMTGEAKSWELAWQKATEGLSNFPNRMAKMEEYFLLEMREGRHKGTSTISSGGAQFVVIESEKKHFFAPSVGKSDSKQFLSYWIDPINFSPFFLVGAKKGEIVPPLMERLPENLNSNDAVEILDDGTIVVTQSITTPLSKGAVHNRLEFKTFNGMPVLEKQIYKEFADDGKLRLESLLEMGQFKQCGSVYMPTQVSRAMGPLGAEKYLYWNWQLDERSLTKPQNTDFAFSVPDSIEIKGELKLKPGSVVDLEVLKGWNGVAADSIQRSGTALSEINPVPPEEKRAGYSSHIGIGVAILLIASFVFFFVRINKSTEHGKEE